MTDAKDKVERKNKFQLDLMDDSDEDLAHVDGFGTNFTKPKLSNKDGDKLHQKENSDKIKEQKAVNHHTKVFMTKSYVSLVAYKLKCRDKFAKLRTALNFHFEANMRKILGGIVSNKRM